MKHVVLCLVTTLCTLACAHKQESAPQPEPAAPTASNNTPPPAQNQNATLASAACKADDACPNDSICFQDSCTPVTAALQACANARVQFPFNSAQMPDSAKKPLMRAARCLSASHDIKLTIEGNADERGTEEYNLALGEQRAKAVARYLETMGATASQIKTISYGKDQPMCTEHDEDCWSKNRRAALKVAND